MLSVHEDRPLRLAFPIGPIRHPEDGGGGTPWPGEAAHHTPTGVPADRFAQAMAERGPRRAAEGHGDRRQPVDPPWGPPGPGSDELGQALGEDPARAVPIGAEELPDTERSHDAEVCPRGIREGTLIVTVEASRRKPAHGTVPPGLY